MTRSLVGAGEMAFFWGLSAVACVVGWGLSMLYDSGVWMLVEGGWFIGRKVQ